MKKKSKIGVIGHIDHGKTTLTAAISHAIASSKDKSIVLVDSLPDIEKKGKTIHEILEEERSIKITPVYQVEVPKWNPSNPKTRRERRAIERKNKNS